MRKGFLRLLVLFFTSVLVNYHAPAGMAAKSPGKPRSQPSPRTTQVSLPASRAAGFPSALRIHPLPRRLRRGACLAHNWQFGGNRGYGSAASLASKRELKKLGVRWISLTPFGWQSSLTSTTVRFRPKGGAGETDARLLREIQQAKRLQLKVMVKPHLWISYHRWRGHIRPAGRDGWERWFKSYTRFLLHYAKLSQRAGADSFVVGVELVTATKHAGARWPHLIKQVRKVFRGQLVYAANWDEVFQVGFWDKVDAIGVQYFAPLSKKRAPSYQDLLRGVRRYLRRLRILSKKHKKPILLTEFGFRSTSFPWINPAAWPEHLRPSQRRYEEIGQAVSYAALMEAARDANYLQGLFLWKWFTDVHTREEGRVGFSPRGKLAAKVLKAAFQ